MSRTVSHGLLACGGQVAAARDHARVRAAVVGVALRDLKDVTTLRLVKRHLQRADRAVEADGVAVGHGPARLAHPSLDPLDALAGLVVAGGPRLADVAR